jgi:hypothetical protein
MKNKPFLIVLVVIIIIGGLWLIGNEKKECGIENCHGLDISCGSDIPDFCTEIYMLGDFCRQYVNCGIIGGECKLLDNPLFEECKSCVEKCSDFECEEECSKRIKLLEQVK